MPLYDFRCPACGTVFEQRVTLAALGQPVPCPACGAPTTDRLVSLPAARTRGASSAAPLPAGGG